jgi:hypothetical protein
VTKAEAFDALLVRAVWFVLGAIVIASLDYGDVWINVCTGACEGRVHVEGQP